MPHHRPRYDRSSGHDSSPSESSGGSDTDDDGPQRRRWTEYSLPGSRFLPQEGPDAIRPVQEDIEMQRLPTIQEGRRATGHHSAPVPINRGGYLSGSTRDPEQEARREAAQKAREERAARERAEHKKHKCQLFSVSACARDHLHALK